MSVSIPRACAGVLALGIIWASGVVAQVPEQLRYQGYLTDTAGQALDAPVNATFALYTLESGGVPLWTDTRVVFPSQGLFSTDLGGPGNPFPADVFSTALFLGITVDSDLEMSPRVALSSAPYAQQARDAETVGGQTATSLDQSTDVAALQSDVGTTQADVSVLQTGVGALGSDVAANNAAIAIIESDVGDNAVDVSQLQTDLAATNGDVTTLENIVPSLQSLVTGSCSSGSSIRQIFSSGSVTCEIDDASLWSLFNSNLYYTGGSIGVGTTSPAAAVQIDAPLGVDPFRARVQSSTKLRVHQNGSVSAGTSSAGPDNGLFVAGDTLLGVGTATSRLTVSDVLWQASLDNIDVGGDDWFLGSSATGWAIGGGKFVISPTDSSTNSALVIDSNKDIGIGVTDPLTRLHLGGGSDVAPTGGGYLTIGGITGANIAVDSNEIMARSNGAVAALNLNVEGGEVRLNTGGLRDHDSLEVRGRVYFDNGGNSGMRITATNSNPTNALLEPTSFEEALIGSSVRPFWRMYSREFYASSPIEYRTYSDRSLKQNVRAIPNALATIEALEGVAYELSKHPMDNRDRQLTDKQQFDRNNQVGFIAQDLEKILPQMVSEDETTGLKTVGYLGVIPILVEALKEQQAIIERQDARIQALEDRIR